MPVVMVKAPSAEFLRFSLFFRACTKLFLDQACIIILSTFTTARHVRDCPMMVDRFGQILATVFYGDVLHWHGAESCIFHEHEGICFQIPRHALSSSNSEGLVAFSTTSSVVWAASSSFTSSFLISSVKAYTLSFGLNLLHNGCCWG